MSNYEDERPFEFSKRQIDLTNAYVSAKMKDGRVIEPLSKFITKIDKSEIDEVVIKSSEHQPLYTLKIIDGQFSYRKRSISKPFDVTQQWPLDDPKRCIVLATKGRVVFYWDSKIIKEFDSWQNDSIYNARDMEKEVKV